MGTVTCNFMVPHAHAPGVCESNNIPLNGDEFTAEKNYYVRGIEYIEGNTSLIITQCKVPPCPG